RMLGQLGAHQQAAVAATHDAEVLAVGPAGLFQRFGGGVEVVENVLLAGLHAAAVPGFAVFVAAADVGVGEHATTFQPGQVGTDETRLDGNVETAVAVQDGRAFAVGRGALHVQHRDRNLRAVLRCAGDARGDHVGIICCR